MHRKPEFDIMKGILIILVVIGHVVSSESFAHQVIYWFHMPVFFMITGILSNWGRSDDLAFIKKRTVSYVVPYFSWCILLFCIFWIEDPLKYLCRILYGGAMNTTSYTYPFWFVCALYISSVVYNWFVRRNVKWLYLAIAFFLLLWYMVLYKYQVISLPWSLEVVPFVLLYFIIGIYANKLFDKMVIVCTIGGCVLALALIFCAYYGIINNTIGMKSVEMHNVIFDVFVPVVFFCGLKGICVMMSKTKVLTKLFSYIGKASLVIMFVHSAMFHVIGRVCIDNDTYLFLFKIIGAVAGGCLIYMGCRRIRILSLLLLGKEK